MSLFICGIRIGINYTACAWSTPSSKDKKISSAYWKTLTGLETNVTSTVAIFSSDMRLLSFGYEAEEQIKAKNITDCLVVSDFVRQIFCDGPKVVKNISANNGVIVSSENVMVKVLRFIVTRQYPMREYSTFYVLTIPSATTDQDGACRFLKKVARRAGIYDVFIIPDATAVVHYCRKWNDPSGEGIKLSSDEQYIVLECEDDSISCSITRRHMTDFKISYKSFSNVPSFQQVQQNLETIFTNIFGKKVFKDFAENDNLEYETFIHDLRQKISSSRKNSQVVITIPGGLIHVFEGEHGEKVKAILQKTTYADSANVVGSKLRMSPDLFHSLFTEVGANIKHVLKQTLEQSGLTNNASVSIIFAGNLSRSVILQNTIKYAFPTQTLIVPSEEPNIEVVKGAVFFGMIESKTLHKMDNESPSSMPHTAQCAVGNKTSGSPQVAKTTDNVNRQNVHASDESRTDEATENATKCIVL